MTIRAPLYTRISRAPGNVAVNSQVAPNLLQTTLRGQDSMLPFLYMIELPTRRPAVSLLTWSTNLLQTTLAAEPPPANPSETGIIAIIVRRNQLLQ